MTSKTVWVVEKGNYSDYAVVGVFSSKESAQLVAGTLNTPDEDGYRGDESTIAEWPLDPAVNELRRGLLMHRVQMHEDGTVDCVEKQKMSSYQLSSHVQIWRRSAVPAYKSQGMKDILSATVWAKDSAHAIKIANEHRVRMIASGEWK